MNVARFDRLARSVSRVLSRRGFLRALGFGVGLAAIRPSGPERVTAGKNTQKLKRNQFGCVNVGGACRGRDSVCCSGICQGKKPKKGERDGSECVAHHEANCTAAHRACTDSNQPQCKPGDPLAICYRTTGQAGFCGRDVIPGCIPCRKDRDCLQQLGEGSACVTCPACPNGKGMCVPPGID